MMHGIPPDPHSIAGKFPLPEEQAELLVIGAGPAGLAAAIQAAQAGKHVVLIDENPVPAALMGLDVPLFYGNRFGGAVQQEARMVERIVASTPAIEAAFDAGVDVRLGQTAWGVFANGSGLHALPQPIAGLTDGTRSWICGFKALILATGARDLVLGFQGIDLPGVMGARAFHALLTQYDAFTGQRLVILGSGGLAIATARAAQSRGLQVAALIEPQPTPQSPEAATLGIPLLTSHTILRAEGDATTVTAAHLTSCFSLPPAGRAGVGGGGSEPGTPTRIEADTIILAIGSVPAIELASVAGCKLTPNFPLGGYLPTLSSHGATSVPGIFAAGDCAGLLHPADPTQAEAQGRAAAAAALAYLAGTTPTHEPAPPATPDAETAAYRLAWMQSLQQTGGNQAPVCLCEEVSRAELLGIQPPRYLGCQSATMAARTGQTLLQDGPFNPDQIKRLTRAGMGPCQGRRCREQIALLLAIESHQPLESIPLASYRAPVRPLPLTTLADTAENPSMQQDWDVWFGIDTQWIPYEAVGTAAEAEILASDAKHGHL